MLRAIRCDSVWDTVTSPRAQRIAGPNLAKCPVTMKPDTHEKKAQTMKNTWIRSAVRGLLVSAFMVGGVGCAAEGLGSVGSESLQGADESSVAVSEITASYPIGTTVATTANLNLRTGPSTSYHIILVMSSGSRAVTVQYTAPQNGFYKVHYGSNEGFAYGGYLRLVSTPGGTTGGTPGGGTGSGGSSALIDRVFQRAAAGVGFSYWWGHGAWLESGPTASTQSSCSGSCPSCSHAGRYGADCSGFVGKAWIVPSTNSNLSTDSHPYSTWNFYNTSGGGQWSGISRGNARHGDALVYNTGSAGHIFLVDRGDPWGSMWVYEAPGCASGGGRIHHTIRTASSAYHAIRRSGL